MTDDQLTKQTQQLSVQAGGKQASNGGGQQQQQAENQQKNSSSFGASLFGGGNAGTGGMGAPGGSFNLAAASFVPNFGAPAFVPGGSTAASGNPFEMTSDATPATSFDPYLPQTGGYDPYLPYNPAYSQPQQQGFALYGAQDEEEEEDPNTMTLDDYQKKAADPKLKAKVAEKLKAKAVVVGLTVEKKKDTIAADAKAAEDARKKAVAATQQVEVEEAPEMTEEEAALEEQFYEVNKKEHMNVVFIGHVDAGKSTMGGHILLLTGMVDARTMEKYQREAREQNRESWYLSWALDSDQNERAKGITVETGTAFFETEKRKYTILDAPGHKNYVPSMITGASQADVGILVISARKGEFETGFEKGGQTREHAMLAKTVGVKRLIVAINKMDDSTVEWSKERYDECVGKLTTYLKQCGYNIKTEVQFIPLSGFTGANLKDPLADGVCPWYSGLPLLPLLDAMDHQGGANDAPFMMPVSEKWREMGVTIVAGKIESGRIRKGKQIVIMPTRKACQVAAIFNEQDDELQGATCGDNARLRLRGVEEEEIMGGYVLCSLFKSVKTVVEFEAQLMILDIKGIISSGYSGMLHVHTCVVEVTLGDMLYLVDPKTKRKSKRPPMFVKKGNSVVARLRTSAPICLETYEDYAQLGRFTIRDEQKTVAMGKVLKLISPEVFVPPVVKPKVAASTDDVAATGEEDGGEAGAVDDMAVDGEPAAASSFDQVDAQALAE